jgi:hypothetical protein
VEIRDKKDNFLKQKETPLETKIVEMCKTKKLQRVSNCTGVEEKLSGVQIKNEKSIRC